MRIPLRFRPLFLLIALFFFSPTQGVAEAPLSLFQQGHADVSLGAGYGSFDRKNYVLLGAGLGYFIADGLEAGVNGEAWLGSSPQIYNVSPQIKYVILNWMELKPYIGGFYRRTFYSREIDAQDSVGGRAGLVFAVSPRSYLSAGLAYEHLFTCDKNLYEGCDNVYPEVGIGFSF